MDSLAEEMRLMEAMRVFTNRSLVPLYEMSGQGKGNFRGSGTAVSIHGHSFLLTSAHVVLYKDGKRVDLAHWQGQDNEAAWVRGDWHVYGKPIDLALNELDNIIDEGTVVPLNLEGKLAASSLNSSSDYLFVQGWPQKGSHFSPTLQTVFTKSLTLLGREDPTSDPAFNSHAHLAVSYRADMAHFTVIESDSASTLKLETDQFVEPHGMSGSLLWRLNWSPDDADWTPEKARVIGLVTDWNHETRRITATRVEHLKANIAQSLQRLGLPGLT